MQRNDTTTPRDQSAAPRDDERAHRRARLRNAAEWVLLVVLLIPAVYRFGPQLLAAVGGPAFGGLVGKPAPTIDVVALDGRRIGPDDLRGKVVVVNFWATWCGPCRVEMPGFERVWTDDRERGLVVLGLSQDRASQIPVSVFLAEHGITYPMAMSTVELDRAFGGIGLLPTTVLIDRRGVVRHVVRGFFAPPALRAAVSRLLDE